MRASRPMAAMVLALLVLPVAGRAEDAPFQSDRPDRTEGPYTVPPGLWQIEFDVASWAKSDDEDAPSTTDDVYDIADFNLKYGITRRLDAQFVAEPYTHVRRQPANGEATTDDGPGDVSLRMKLNVRERERYVMGMIPYVTVPTRGDSRGQIVEWGVILPVDVPLANDRSIGLEILWKKQDGLDAWWGGSASFATPLGHAFGAFAEVFAARAGFDDHAPSDVTIDTGLTYNLRANWQVDAAVYRGITDGAEDWRVFTGMSVRL